MESIIISLLAGAAGGSLAGEAAQSLSIGRIGNAMSGLVGGGLSSQFMSMLGPGAATSAGGMDLGSVAAALIGGGAGGAVTTLIVGIVRNAMPK